ncbi:MAG TPA: hypothetical protein VFM45_13745, partial [Anaeromyxobacteraceae bacterium]|nr:hypothetical protein [Anaeromyxobacteraceae bacterium]
QSVHYASDYNLLAGSASIVSGSFLCWNCHATAAPVNGAQGNRSGKDVQTEIAKANGHPVATTDNLHATAAEAVATYNDGSFTGAKRHVACVDCHDAHEAGKTLRTYPTTGSMTSTRNQVVAGGPLVGAPGVVYTAPTAYATGTIAVATTGVVTGTGTTWTAAIAPVGSLLYVGGTASGGNSNRWYVITAFTSATSVTVTPAPTTAIAAGTAYRIVPKSAAANFSTNPVALTAGSAEASLCFKCHSAFAFGAGMPLTGGTTYVTGTAAFTSGSAIVTGTGTAWTTNHVGWVIKNNANGVWYRVMAFVSATSLVLDRPAAATVATSAYTLQQGLLDMAEEFSPTNTSGHPVVTGLQNYTGNTAPKALTVGQMRAPWNAAGNATTGTGVGYQTMACTDCHSGDAASPAVQGPHGSATNFMLRGTNKTWPNLTLSSTNYGTSFCANCHTWSTSTPSNHPHGVGNHSSLRCYNCHVVVPHGGKLARLMGDGDGAEMPSRYSYQGTKSNTQVTGFTKPSAGYSETNCGASGSCASKHPSTSGSLQNW